MCEAFKKQGFEVTLIHPFYFLPKYEKVNDIWSYYGIKNRFKVVTLPTILSNWTERIPGMIPLSKIIPYLFYGVSLWLHRKISQRDIIYARCSLGATFFTFLRRISRSQHRPYIAFEVHEYPRGISRFSVLRKVDKIIAINHNLKKDLMIKATLPEEKILIEPDGVDIEFFNNNRISKEEARKKLGLPSEKKFACYIGHFYGGRGIEDIIESSVYFNKDVVFLMVGGYESDIARYRNSRAKEKFDNVKFIGFVDPSLVPNYLFASDVLIAPYTQKISTSDWMSPLKIFEYMAAKRPIVSSNLPAIREILTNNHNAVLVTPENPRELAQAINKLLEDKAFASGIAEQAYVDVQKYSWKNRCERILNFIGKV